VEEKEISMSLLIALQAAALSVVSLAVPAPVVIPEPSTAGLVACGVLAVMGLTLRRRRE
jgi:predicted transporter